MPVRPGDSTSKRKSRIAVLGPETARCEKCGADCSEIVGEWVITGLCAKHTGKTDQQRIAGR